MRMHFSFTDDMIISPGDSTTITVSLSADSVSGQFSKYVDIFYEEKETPDRLIVYGYSIKN